MKASEFLKKKLSSPATHVAATLTIATIGLMAPNLSESSCPAGNLGDCETTVSGGTACIKGGWWDDCGLGSQQEESE